MTHSLIDTAPCGYFSFADNGEIRFVNAHGCTCLGYQKETLPGKNVEAIFTLPTRIFFQTHLFPLLRLQGKAEEIYITLLCAHGEQLPVLLNANRQQEDTEPLTSCSFIVVRNRKKFEDELVLAKKQAEKALLENTALMKARAELQMHAEELDIQIQMVRQQNHELNQLNHVITHSLREPLRKILVYTEKLESISGSAEQESSLARLMNASLQLKNTISGLQQYVWLNETPTTFVEADLQSVVQAASAKVLAESGALKLETDPLPVIEGDLPQLELLFYHLLSNAVKFRRGVDAVVRIKATLLKQNRFQNMDGKYQYEDFVRIDLQDEGIGFNPSASETIFELFRKMHFSDGIGLGLSLCKKITENHSGSIRAEGKENEGSRFTLLLPIRQTFRGNKSRAEEMVKQTANQ